MTRTHVAAVIALLAAALLPASAAHADPVTITATCTTSAGTGSCSSTDWYTTGVTVSFTLSGTFSNPQGCGDTIINTDTTGTDLTCTVVTDPGTGATQSLDVVIKRDATPPSAAIAADRSPDSNGWYNHPVGITVSGSDATSGIASCTSSSYSGPDSVSASVDGTCTDNAGNVSAPVSLPLEYDATPPSSSTITADRTPDSNGWYNHPVGITVSGADTTSGIASCTTSSFSGPDSASASASGTCTDNAGNMSAPLSLSLKYDSTPPSASAIAAARAPDSNGWYNHPVGSTVSGADTTSGIASCTTSSFSGPDSASASVSGTCTDNAGNESSTLSLSLKYDSTPPTVSANSSRGPDTNGWYNHPLSVSFDGSDALSRVVSCSSGSYCRSGRFHGFGRRHVRRPGWEHRVCVLLAQVRLDSADRQGGDPRPAAGHERLVQPPGHDHILRQRRELRHRVLPDRDL